MKKIQIDENTFIIDETPVCPESKKVGKEMADKVWEQVKGSIDRESIRPLFGEEE